MGVGMKAESIIATVVGLCMTLFKGKDTGPRTLEELKIHQQQRHAEVEASFLEHQKNHPECDELGRQWREAEQNILCGKCKQPLFPNGLEYLSAYYVCPSCGAKNGSDPIAISGVSHFGDRSQETYYDYIGMGEWNRLRHEYFYCMGWWKK